MEADLDQPMTQLTTTRPPLEIAESMKEVVVGKYLNINIDRIIQSVLRVMFYFLDCHLEIFDSGRSST